MNCEEISKDIPFLFHTMFQINDYKKNIFLILKHVCYEFIIGLHKYINQCRPYSVSFVLFNLHTNI